MNRNKITIGISQGDANGVGLEVVIKAFSHEKMYDWVTPILYGSPKAFAFHKKIIGIQEPVYNLIKSAEEAKQGKLNLIITSSDEIEYKPGNADNQTGKEAFLALERMVQDAGSGKLDAIVTAPIDKSTIKLPDGKEFTGHTGYIASKLDETNYMMFLVSDDLKVGLVTEHVPLAAIASVLTKEKIVAKINLMNNSLRDDFGIRKPRIAVLGLNPHAGDKGLLGKEEKDTIEPAIQTAYKDGIMVFGPYPADGFFGAGQYKQFDGVLALYHDQGLIPFKLMAFEDGVNYTSGLKIVRTSPDHGTAYDIAGKNIASPESFRKAIYTAISIFNQRNLNHELAKNPLPFSELKRERFRLEL